MLRSVFSVAGCNHSRQKAAAAAAAASRTISQKRTTGLLHHHQYGRTFATQSGDDAVPPTALAKLHLEDGTTLTAKSFGCHTSVEGEVRTTEGKKHHDFRMFCCCW